MVDRIIRHDIDGLKFVYYVDKEIGFMAEIQRDIFLHKNYEPYSTDIVKSVLKEGDVAVDVGASIGYFTLQFAKAVGKTGKVYSFEPITLQIPYLEENIRFNGFQDRVKVYNLAASDINGTIMINPSHKSEVQGVILDEILSDVPKIDFIKIDVDGTENQVLKGLSKTFEKNKDMKMLIEYYPKYLEMAGNSPKEFMDLVGKFFKAGRVMGEYTDDYYNLYCIRK